MPTRKQIVTTVDVHDPLSRLRARSVNQLAEAALFLLGRLGLGQRRGAPEPHLGAGRLARLVGRVQAHALHHGVALDPALLLGAVTFLADEHLLEGADEVGLGAQQHAADEVGGGDAGGALDDLEAAGLLDEAVAVVAVAVRGDVVAVDDVLAAVVGDVGQGRHVRGISDGFGDPAAGVGGGEALLERHDGWALVGEDVLVRVDAGVELIAEEAGLHDGTSMTCLCLAT